MALLEPSIEGKGTSLILLTRIQTLKGAEKGFRGEEKRAAKGDVGNICSANGGAEMKTLRFSGKEFYVDSQDFLRDMDQWDETFASGLAPSLGIVEGLSDMHWRVINFIRDTFTSTGTCPSVIQTCRKNGLQMKDLEALFPAGYLRGAVKLAGIAVNYFGQAEPKDRKVYRMDAFGFLDDPLDWDEDFAVGRAHALGMTQGLSDEHWKVIRYLRESYKRDGKLPTVYECCKANGLDIDGLEKLFPCGYRRGAVMISGLR